MKNILECAIKNRHLSIVPGYMHKLLDCDIKEYLTVRDCMATVQV